MFVDLPPLPDLAAIIAPQEVKKKRRNGKANAIVLGTILVLSDGSKCVVSAFDAQGNPLCYPILE